MRSVQYAHTDHPALGPIRYMLRRWPPATLLNNEPDKVRMASVLAREEVSMDELADLSEQTLTRCAEFLQALHELEVLEVHQPSIRLRAAPKTRSC